MTFYQRRSERQGLPYILPLDHQEFSALLKELRSHQDTASEPASRDLIETLLLRLREAGDEQAQAGRASGS